MGHTIEYDHYQPMQKIGTLFKWTFDGDGHKESQ